MKKLITATAILLGAATFAMAQNDHQKSNIYAEVGYGFGKTLFFSNTKEQLKASYGGTFNPGNGNSLMMGFYYAPGRWKGFGLGSRIKGTFGSSVKGDNGDSYIFNYYNLAVTGKYYLLSKEFNKGLYVRGSVGFGQFTSKRVNETANLYRHQYAIGSSLMGGIGWTFKAGRKTISIESEFDYSNRNGTIDGKGSASYRSGMIGGNIILSF